MGFCRRVLVTRSIAKVTHEAVHGRSRASLREEICIDKLEYVICPNIWWMFIIDFWSWSGPYYAVLVLRLFIKTRFHQRDVDPRVNIGVI